MATTRNWVTQGVALVRSLLILAGLYVLLNWAGHSKLQAWSDMENVRPGSFWSWGIASVFFICFLLGFLIALGIAIAALSRFVRALLGRQ